MQDTSQDKKYITLLTIFMQVLRGWHFLRFAGLGVFGGDFFGFWCFLGGIFVVVWFGFVFFFVVLSSVLNFCNFIQPH